MRVSLFAPVRQDAEVLALALESHRALLGVDRRVYVDDNVDPLSSDLLMREAADDKRVSVLRPPGLEAAEYVNHTWTQGALSRIAAIRNLGVRHFLSEDFEAMFTVDADTIVNPNTVVHMASFDSPIAGGVHWSKWPGCSLWLPNTWDYHPYGFLSNERVISLKSTGRIRVGGNGGCNFIRREVFAAGVDYTPMPSMQRICWGEDRWFAIRAESHGFEIWADSDYPPFHVYTPNMLPEARKWWAEGAHPGYFRKYWLTSAWEEAIRKYKF